ncbi:MAG: glycosyltransferase family 1 protein [Bradyrhizobium sp.]|uniref:glycosyltransferase family 1 protein n=1 Tax=Bradyrhizobium sp. TaxID=376 RepID=UPI002904545D|nr:glycosyltransferase family 1 protein [Bradyrhizobium sp.]MDU1802472.1 glycosyltransferase family 1 protein [Bradyrhizobium sp.]
MTSILIISEALGEPNHKRGIFHFTRELLRSLAAEGHELTLLVETTRRYRKLRKRQQQSRLFAANSRLIELLALYRFLDEADMNASASRSGLRQRVDWLRSRLTVSVSAEYCRCFLRALGFWFPRHDALENRTECLEYIPPDLRHLRLFRKFLLEPGFYSYQDSSAFFRLPPPRIDARGYDIVLIDTPTRVAVRRDAGTRVICVVHDLLPLTDLKLSDAATRLFLSRLATSIAQADELAFVSNYSLERFRELMPQHAHLPARVVYPRTRFDEAAPPIATAAGAARPSFVVIVSAEPRKNLDALIRAFRRLPQADLVVIDAPCTGTGTWRRNPDAKWRMRPGALEIRLKDQAEVLDRAAGLVKPGGRIAYITCSVLQPENGDQVRGFVARHPEFSIQPPDQTATVLWDKAEAFAEAALKSDEGWLMTPRRTGTDGFFVSVLKKA